VPRSRVGILEPVSRSKVLVVVACVALTAGSTTAASPTARPKLQALDLQPLVVRGTAFRPYERVKLILSADVAAGRTLKAGPTGRFVTRFRAVSVGRCEGFVLQAFGSRGSRAKLERLTPDCMEP
jgi:hypothetical protein